ncbi:YlaF family protein [Pseudalkalibacillus decolorationis]|uniref:YlaF family protein n=1 Tax=Pseudalkalibacillus decolorationis TaxID=163879 RepID=UPI002148DE00|nr:YlaF family protein [Pseudalkalibacillus decolorationis]
MNKRSIIFIVISILVTFCIALIGVALGEQSILLAIIALLASFILMGVGFSLKKKFRESDEMKS